MRSAEQDVAESLLKKQINDIKDSMYHQLRDTIHPSFDPYICGYKTADHARLVITQQTMKQVEKLLREFERKFPD